MSELYTDLTIKDKGERFRKACDIVIGSGVIPTRELLSGALSLQGIEDANTVSVPEAFGYYKLSSFAYAAVKQQLTPQGNFIGPRQENSNQ